MRTISDLSTTIRTLSDEDLQMLVSYLSADYLRNADTAEEYTTASTMGAMIYAYKHSRTVIASRDASLRDQANGNY